MFIIHKVSHNELKAPKQSDNVLVDRVNLNGSVVIYVWA